MNLPLFLTWLRIAAIPLLVLVFLFAPESAARPLSAWIFGLAAATDFLDGYLARRWNQQSSFGAFLDPVADKLIVAAALILLVYANGDIWIVLAAIIIIGREILISALREWMAETGNRAAVAVSQLGKWKTIAQMFAIMFMLNWFPLWDVIPVYQIGYWLLMVSAVLTLASGALYGMAAWRAVRAQRAAGD
ncbi:CDP-diacylglycerol--glycerol-3-phosphate 3-phosphatidyltransferase [Halothiobacillus diazotrophicus]|uniref:CDP-diacylglycerol--glycerol-3-phosphate 3-phosphatidyltransferase n=1 Tax=Halothiobacillus diazotrophicus TaxID=1860122 RepID=A0A191ZET2_9GAMM|nr:CDP-diacylglycerol--glycerol-3-phosphate 3-phosphatidyltransferase [Halothiobacillus diazotrophicus]ANJ66386.1 CDP-diacylglycerol--glycerol-3-phosphate 3-phosphatidyltransferase [Halothiobacillus diazotrophicus]